VVKIVHTFVIVLLFGVAAMAGTYALVQSTLLGQSSSPASDRQIQIRQQALDRAEAKLREAVSRRPPALPKLPNRTRPPQAAPMPVTHATTIATAPAITSNVSSSAGEHEDSGHEGGDND
jgi:hypothetical protein